MPEPRAAVLALAAVPLLAGLAACGGDGTAAIGASSGCDGAPKAAVADVRAAARDDSAVGDRRAGAVEVTGARVADLPASLREHGAERLLAVAVEAALADDAATSVPAVRTTAVFALDGDGTVLGPVSDTARTLFSVADPTESGWAAWAAKASDSDVGEQVRECVG